MPAQQRGLEHEVGRPHRVEQGRLPGRVRHANQLFVEGNGQGRGAAEGRQRRQLPGRDWLLDGVDVKGRQLRQLGQGIGGTESTVGIHAQPQLRGTCQGPDFSQDGQLGGKVEAPNLQLQAGVAVRQLLPNLLAHEGRVAHPHQAVDGQRRLAPAEGVGVELPPPATGQVEQRGFERKGQRGQGQTHKRRRFGHREGDKSAGVEAVAELGYGGGKFRAVIGAEAGQRRGFSHAHHVRGKVIAKVQVPGHVFGQGPARSAGRKVEAKGALRKAET